MCNNSVLGKQEIGDATELALLHMGKELGYDKKSLEEQYPRTYEIPFDSEKKYMVSVHKDSGHEKLALLHMGKELGYDKKSLEEQYPRTYEIPFDSEKKYMVSVHKDSGHETAYSYGKRIRIR